MKSVFKFPKWVFSALLITICAGLGGALFIQSGGLSFFQAPALTPAEKVEHALNQSLSKVLKGVVGEGKYYVSVKAIMTDNAEESEQITLTPLVATSSQKSETRLHGGSESPDTQALKSYFEKQPIQKITKALPGFPILNPVEEKSVPVIPTKTVQTPTKTSTLETATHVYFNQEKVKKWTPFRIKTILIHVVIDERMLKLHHVDKVQLTALLSELAGIQESRSDQLIVSSYPFSNAVFGLDQFVDNLKKSIRDLGWPPEWFAGIFAGLIGLFISVILFLFWKSHREHVQLELSLEEADKLALEEKRAKMIEQEFQDRCKAIIEFVKRNKVSTARVLSELIMAPPETNGVLLTPLQKALVFILFMQTDHADTVNELLTELGESMSKTLLKSLEKPLKVDAGTLRIVMDEFYNLLVQKQTVMGGPSLSYQLFTSAFGAPEVDLSALNAPFQFLESVSDDKLLHFLHSEPPQLGALLFSFMPETRSAGLLSRLELSQVSLISKRMLSLHVPNYTMIQQLSAALEVHLFAPEAGINLQEKVNKLAKIVEQAPLGLRQHLLQEFESEDPGIAQKIKSIIFTFEDLLGLTDEDLKAVIFESGIEQVGVAMLGGSADIQSKISAVLSDRMTQIVRDIHQMAANQKPTDIDLAQLHVVNIAKVLAKSGIIIFVKKEDSL